MQVFKFGGSAIKAAEGIRNLGKILRSSPECRIVVVSALAKTTNALEEITDSFVNGTDRWLPILKKVKIFHFGIIGELFPSGDHLISRQLERSFTSLEQKLTRKPSGYYDQIYDQVVSYGEIWSTRIVYSYLKDCGIQSKWLDIRKLLITDQTFREASVDWVESRKRLTGKIQTGQDQLYILQGFIGGTSGSLTTTLGREGSDYTAAILGNIFDAEKVIIWKDVPGIMNADPTEFSDPEKLDEISYLEAVELAFFGAKIIHPKTIKPLFNKKIPLIIKSFRAPDDNGTIIHSVKDPIDLVPVYVKKHDQILITIRPRDFSFIIGESLGKIFHSFNSYRIKVNLIQNSAISLSICADNSPGGINKLISELEKEFRISYNEDVQLVTIRHYTTQAVSQMSLGKEILIEQKSRQTTHLVLRDM